MPQIFENTATREPLTQSAEDWGIESENEILLSESSGDEICHISSAPISSPTVTLPSNSLRPLKLGRDGRVYTREIRFRMLLKSLFCQRVSVAETERFMEQFRYIIISSSLLEAQPLYSNWSLPTDLRRRRLLFDTNRPWTHLYVQQISSFSGSGSVAALALYLHLRYRASSSRAERSSVAIVIFLVVVIYLFATSRRRLRRSIREKVLVYMEMTVQSIKFLDGDLVRVLKELQELDFVVNGFAPNARSNFVSNQLTSADRRRQLMGRRLRSVMGSSLHLICESYLSALRECAGMASAENLGKFLEIYGLSDVMADFGFEWHSETLTFTFNPSERFELSGAGACYVSVSALKRELSNLHFLRRMLLCALLAVEPDQSSASDELEKWTIIADNLVHINNLSEELSRVISTERFVGNVDPNQSVDRSQERRGNYAALVNVMARVKHLNARIDIVNETDASESEYHMHVRAVREEIDDLKSKWDLFLRSSEPTPIKTYAMQTEPSEQNSDLMASPTLIMTPDLGDTSAFSSIATADMDCYDSSEHLCPSIFEGESPSFIMSSSKLSREERIKISRRNRENSIVREPDPHSTLAQELTNVLMMRSQMNTRR